MPFVNVKLAGSITKEQKQEVTKEITEILIMHAHKSANYTYLLCLKRLKQKIGRLVVNC